MTEESRQAARTPGEIEGRGRVLASWRLSLLIAVIVLAACGKGTTPSAPSASGSTTDELAAGDAAPKPMEAREAAQWQLAKDGDAEELMRLADLVGCEGLRERATQQAALLPTAVRAAAYCRDFSELPWLARVGTEGGDDAARAALESAVDLAARPRRATDPDDASDLHAGCGALLSLARSTAPKARRALAIRALRMLSERGCVKRPDIPTDLDVH